MAEGAKLPRPAHEILDHPVIQMLEIGAVKNNPTTPPREARRHLSYEFGQLVSIQGTGESDPNIAIVFLDLEVEATLD